MVMAFYGLALADGRVYAAMMAVANNAGKHPPGLEFMLFSVGGALILLALALAGGAAAAKALLPLTVVGSDALKAFIFDIVMIFLVLRFLLQGEGMYTYTTGVWRLRGVLILGAAVWISVTRWIAAHTQEDMVCNNSKAMRCWP